MNENELAVIPEQNSLQLTRRASDAAGACKAIVTKTAIQIGPKKYVPVEGWQAIANSLGCVASARDVEMVEGGIRATGEVRRVDTGIVIATAEGFLGDDEPIWCGGTDARGKEHPARPLYARRAMAQTRAVSRACRSAFAFIVTLMDAGLQTTPAEEMHGVIDAESIDLKTVGGADLHLDGTPRPIRPTQRKATAPAELAGNEAAATRQASTLGGEEVISFIPLDSTERKNAKGKVWYECVLPDGRKCTTFDEKMHEMLKEAAMSNMTVRAVITSKTKDGKTYANFAEIREA